MECGTRTVTTSKTPAYKQLVEEIHKQLQMIKDIALEFEPDLVERIDGGIHAGLVWAWPDVEKWAKATGREIQ
jgi:hypothetical protein